MEIKYQTDLYASYLQISMEESADYNKYSFKMLEKNKIKGVLGCKRRVENGKSYLSIDITGKKNLYQEYQEREMNLEELTDLFQNLIKIMEEIREYLLTEKMAVLEPEFIYKDMDNGKIYLTVVPWEREEEFPLRKLAEFLLEKMKPTDENGITAAYYFYRGQSQPQFSIYQFLSVLEKENIISRKKENIKEKGKKNEEEIYEKEALEKEYKEPEVKENKSKENKYLWIVCIVLSFVILTLSFLPFLEKNQKIACISFSIATFIMGIIMKLIKNKSNMEKKEETEREKIEEEEETIFFRSTQSREILKIQWKDKNKKKEMEIRDLPMTIGKKKEQVTLYLSDLSVSRIHCKIFEEEGKIVIMDLESTNGTYLNGIKLNKQEKQEIVKNDEILIGKVKLLVV